MFSLKKNVKRLFKKKKTKKKRCNMKNCIALHYFLVSVSSFVALWFVFLDSVSVLRLNFVFLCVCFRLGMLTSVLGFVFLFSGSVFLFWVYSLLFLLLLLLSCGFLFLSVTLYI